jgi:predicted ATP-grasp superfamily ATP-dependent carboligase
MSSASTVLVFEFFTGGGCPEGELPDGLAAEALGMLRAALQDFHAWGAVRTLTALDPRFEKRFAGLGKKILPADEVVAVFPAEHEKAYSSLLKRCDAVLVIAPETDGILSGLIEQAETEGVGLLNSNSSAIVSAGNKATCCRLFELAKLPTPETRTASFATAPRIALQMGCPLVVKPLDGVGCEGVCLLNRFSDLPGILESVRESTSHEQILLQSLAEGIHASVSLLVAEGSCLPLSFNLQLVEAGVPFKYLGSRVPFSHPAGHRAMDLASLAAGLIPGLKGYIGIDLVLADNLIQLIEINPRLTTSYIGLRRVSRVNLAQAIWEACQNGLLPDHIPLEGQVEIRKDDPNSWGL